MDGSKRPPRRPLTVVEAQTIAEDLRHDRCDSIADARFPEGFELQVATLRGVSVTNCHLWLTVGGGMFRGGVVEECRFVDVDLDPFTVHTVEMRANVFERVTFGARTTGIVDDTVVDDTSFRDCRILDMGFRKSTFRGVMIEGGQMDRIRFASCTFIDTRLSSTMRDVILADGRFERADMSGSDVVDVTFDEWRSTDLRLPARRTGFFVTPAAASEALVAVGEDLAMDFRDRVFADLIMAGHDLVAVSERFLTSSLGAGPREASVLVDALFPYRLDRLDLAGADIGPTRTPAPGDVAS